MAAATRRSIRLRVAMTSTAERGAVRRASRVQQGARDGVLLDLRDLASRATGFGHHLALVLGQLVQIDEFDRRVGQLLVTADLRRRGARKTVEFASSAASSAARR
jgi:hypothetical protein